MAFAQYKVSQTAMNSESHKTVTRFEEIGGLSETFAKGDDVGTKTQSNSGIPVSGTVFTGLEENFDDEHGRMITSEDASTSACPDLAQNENTTADETGTNNEQISHGAHQDSLQIEMTLEEKLNGKSGDDADFEKTLNNQANCNLDPTVFFCKFSNSFNNCWMNATMHSILNLSITRKYLTQNPEKVFGALSGTPLCATFLCTALNNPGKYFCPDEIYQVLIELSRTIPSLALGQPNDITEFLEAILIWLHPCGINSLCKVKNVITCEDCAVVTPIISELGPVIYLSDAQPNETTESLLERFVFVEWSQRQCCNTFSFYKKFVDSSPDVVTLYLHRYTNEEDNRLPVIPSATLHIPLESGIQLYRLSSVICCKILNATTNHFYAYVVGRKRVFKADGAKIRIAEQKADQSCGGLTIHWIVKPWIQEEQSGCGVLAPLYTLSRVLEDFAQSLHMCFIDLEKEFDHVPLGMLGVGLLQEYGVPGPLRQAAKSLYDQYQSLVRITASRDLQLSLEQFAAECEAARMGISAKFEAMVSSL
ncbi:uncharacterized protein LOC122827490 [Gambusia affinis]|uniref:uncharacterized protein LOC122827490 n=1 Tax=Gambusia affinis TaxID=33528 RepID=UPI001CDD29D0|nr:uncharacterized protein LOC122827490 [Gambusia affinis]